MKGREDDNVDTIRNRFKVYRESTLPVIEYYKSKGKVHKVIILYFYFNCNPHKLLCTETLKAYHFRFKNISIQKTYRNSIKRFIYMLMYLAHYLSISLVLFLFPGFVLPRVKSKESKIKMNPAFIWWEGNEPKR